MPERFFEPIPDFSPRPPIAPIRSMALDVRYRIWKTQWDQYQKDGTNLPDNFVGSSRQLKDDLRSLSDESGNVAPMAPVYALICFGLAPLIPPATPWLIGAGLWLVGGGVAARFEANRQGNRAEVVAGAVDKLYGITS